MTNQWTCLYRMYSRLGTLLYIGITNSPPDRFAQHATDKPWWPEVAHISKEWHPTRPAAEHAEQRAIKRERPRYNIEHNLANPHRVPYRKRGTSPTRRRRRKMKRRRQGLAVWGWLAVAAVIAAPTGAIGAWLAIAAIIIGFIAHKRR